MLNEVKCNVWDKVDNKSIVFILTNDTIIDGRNPMGGGIAREVLDRNPGIDVVVGYCIKNKKYNLGKDKQSGARIVRFPTKYNVHDRRSNINLIEESLKMAKAIAEKYTDNTLYIPRPGCGFGGLSWENTVKPLCEKYLDNLPNVKIVYF